MTFPMLHLVFLMITSNFAMAYVEELRGGGLVDTGDLRGGGGG